jgi:hypothetical protein
MVPASRNRRAGLGLLASGFPIRAASPSLR